MKLSLRASVMSLVAVVNLSVFGAGLFWLADSFAIAGREQEQEYSALLAERLRVLIQPGEIGTIQAGNILNWSSWDKFYDAVIMQVPREASQASGVSAAAPPRRVEPGDQRQTYPYDGYNPPANPYDPNDPRYYDSYGNPLRERRTELTLQSKWNEIEAARQAELEVRDDPQADADDKSEDEELNGGELEDSSDPEDPNSQGADQAEPDSQPGEADPSPRSNSTAGAPRLATASFKDPIPSAARGITLHPVGSPQRTGSFDLEQVMAGIRQAAEVGQGSRLLNGHVIPVLDPAGGVWGGCWYVLRPTWTLGGLLRQLAPWFLVSTLLLTFGNFAALRRLVLQPVEVLAHGARRLAQGDLSVRLPEPRGSDEVSDLVRGFNSMAGQVQGFNARLKHEVKLATEQARSAEQAAMTQRRLAATGELAAGIAHEINNPLGGMLNAIEVLERPDLAGDRRREYLRLVRGGLERIGRTVGQVLRLAPRETRTELVRLCEPLNDALGLVRHRAGSMGVRILLKSAERIAAMGEVETAEMFGDLPPVMGEANELGQAALNLLVNALDAIEEGGQGGEIVIALERVGDELLWVFKDDGPGLDAEELGRAADIFYTTKETGKGTGLGLAIVHNVIAGHGGSVLLDSRPGEGFRVELRLPIASDGKTA